MRWLGPGEEVAPVFRQIQTIEMSIMGERFQYRFLLDEETLTHRGDTEYLTDHLVEVFKSELVAKFKREMEKVNG